MEMRPTGWIIGFVVLAVFAFIAMFAIQREQSSNELSRVTGERNNAQAEVDKTRDAIARMKERIAEAKDAAAARKAVSGDIEKLETALIASGKQRDELKRQWEKTRDAFQKEFTAAGKKQIGRKFPSLKVNHEVLDNVTVKAVGAEDVTLEHSAGLTKVPLAKLPPELAPFFVAGWKPELKIEEPAPVPGGLEIDDAMPEVAALKKIMAEPALAEPATPDAPAAPRAALEVNPFITQIEKVTKERNDLQIKMDAVELEYQAKYQTYAVLEAEYARSRMRSSIVTIPRGLEEAKKAFLAVQLKLTAVRQQMGRLRQQISELTSKESRWEPAAK